MELEENVRGAEGKERARRTDVNADRNVALFLGEAKNGGRSRGRAVWWSAALQGRVCPRSMLLIKSRDAEGVGGIIKSSKESGMNQIPRSPVSQLREGCSRENRDRGGKRQEL